MRLNSNALIFLILLVFSNIFLSCRVSNLKFNDENKNSTVLKKIEAQELISKVNQNNVRANWTMLNTKVLVKNNKREFTVNANIHIKKDSIIWASIKTSLGIEILRSVITHDSIYVLDRINKVYYSNSSSYLDSIINFNLNYSQIEHILTASQQIILTDDFETEQYFMSDLDLWTNDRKEKHTIDIINFKIKEFRRINSLSDTYLRVLYNDFKIASNILFPHKIIIESKDSDQGAYSANITCKKVRFNKKLSLSFNIPKSYKKID